MKSVNIKLNLMTDGAKFVQIVGAYPYDMDLRSGRHVVAWLKPNLNRN